MAQELRALFVADGKCYRLWDLDPATTDAEHATNHVPSFQEHHLSTLSKQKGQIVFLSLFYILFWEDRRFSEKGGFELFDQGIAQRCLTMAQAELFAFG